MFCASVCEHYCEQSHDECEAPSGEGARREISLTSSYAECYRGNGPHEDGERYLSGRIEHSVKRCYAHRAVDEQRCDDASYPEWESDVERLAPFGFCHEAAPLARLQAAVTAGVERQVGEHLCREEVVHERRRPHKSVEPPSLQGQGWVVLVLRIRRWWCHRHVRCCRGRRDTVRVEVCAGLGILRALTNLLNV